MFRLATSLLILALMVSVAGPVTATDKGLGLTVQNNLAAMVVDLNPSYANVKIEGGDGNRADAAMTRYRTGRVTPLQSLQGTSGVGQSNAGAVATATAAPAGTPR